MAEKSRRGGEEWALDGDGGGGAGRRRGV